MPALAKLARMLMPKRRWAQFSLGSMFLVVTVLCVALGVQVNKANRRREAVEAIEAWGGGVTFPDDRDSANPLWSERFHDIYGDIQAAEVVLASSEIPDAGLSHLQCLTKLRSVSLYYSENVTDEGLQFLAALPHLDTLNLSGTKVTSKGLKRLLTLPKLGFLELEFTDIDDDAVEALARLSTLKYLCVYRTRMTEDGVEKLRAALPFCKVVDQDLPR
jgi:hypothetical protein